MFFAPPEAQYSLAMYGQATLGHEEVVPALCGPVAWTIDGVEYQPAGSTELRFHMTRFEHYTAKDSLGPKMSFLRRYIEATGRLSVTPEQFKALWDHAGPCRIRMAVLGQTIDAETTHFYATGFEQTHDCIAITVEARFHPDVLPDPLPLPTA